jgi:isopenicillin-N N-acyltransferase-like protein
VHRFRHIVIAAGDPFARGKQLGQATRGELDAALALYKMLLVRSTGLSWAELRDRATAFWEPIEAYDPSIAREIEGIAAGGGRRLDEILALNTRTELMYGLGDAPATECTSMLALPPATEGGAVLLAQNWDWRRGCAATTIAVDLQQGDRPRICMVAEAGIVGKMGFNDSGIGVVFNLLTCDADRGAAAVPVHVMLRGILNSRTLEEAREAVTRATRAASANVIIASADGPGLVLETAPGGDDQVWPVEPCAGLMSHANHFETDVPVTDTLIDHAPDSPFRSARARELLRAARPRVSATP